MGYTREERLDIGKQIYNNEISKSDAAIKYKISEGALGMDDTPEEENEGQETSGHNVQKLGQEEKTETGESVADAQAPYPVENAGHNYAVDNSSPQGLKLTAGMADKPVQRASLREKLEAFKAKAAGTEKQENRKEKGKEVTM